MPSTPSHVKRPSTPNDLEMTDSMQASPRQPLPTSVASFALSHSTTNSTPSSPSASFMAIDDFSYPTNVPQSSGISSYPLYRKIRRSSLLSLHRDRLSENAHSRSQSRGTQNSSSGSSSPITIGIGMFPRASTPLNMDRNDTEAEIKGEEETRSVTEVRRPDSRTMTLDESEQPDNETQTAEPVRMSTPPPRLHSPFNPSIPSSSDVSRKLSLKPPRLLTLLSESKPIEQEMRSEASFQRLVASHADLPISFHPRTPRSARGRFPESVGFDDDEREKTASDDEESDYPPGYPQSVVGEGSLGQSAFEEHQWSNNSPAGAGSGMDVDMANSYGSPSVAASPAATVAMSGASTPVAGPSGNGSSYFQNGHNGNGNGWRDSPTASGRVQKRKHTGEERYEPYSYPSSKRRAVSPSVSLSHAITSSATSSPISITIPPNFGSVPRSPVSLSRSVHSSPILRPVHRLPGRAYDKEERQRSKKIQGAGDGVRTMNLGE